MKHGIRILAAGALVAAATAALAAGQKPDFAALDKDRNGKVSIAEASDHDGLFVAFKELDKDKDGELTKEEFAGYKER